LLRNLFFSFHPSIIDLMPPPGLGPSITVVGSGGGAGGGGGGGAGAGGVAVKRKSTGKSSHSRSYPRGVGLDFRKLAGLTLVSYIDHHGEYCRGVVWCGVANDKGNINIKHQRAGGALS
jgi:hypothetical protein